MFTVWKMKPFYKNVCFLHCGGWNWIAQQPFYAQSPFVPKDLYKFFNSTKLRMCHCFFNSKLIADIVIPSILWSMSCSKGKLNLSTNLKPFLLCHLWKKTTIKHWQPCMNLQNESLGEVICFYGSEFLEITVGKAIFFCEQNADLEILTEILEEFYCRLLAPLTQFHKRCRVKKCTQMKRSA